MIIEVLTGASVATLIAAIAKIATTRITEKERTTRLGMLLESKRDASDSNIDRDSIGTTTTATQKSPSPSWLALVCVCLATLNLAFMSFGPHAADALSTGGAASVGQSLCLFASGFWLLIHPLPSRS